ncbi:MAG TPA: alpha/beta fold hydrolase [Candidatus Polarisedimenticolia bacterium]|nr:alpha/beta fold hydrolase [Candidatus Polarisedimenticolia bacterium]
MPRIESFFLAGPAGRLECLLKHPAVLPPQGAAAVLCHPHPLFGGTMHNKVVHAAAEALARLSLPVLRFNFRGVGGSGGTHDAGRGEQDDLVVVLDHLAERFPGHPLLAAGYSFGAHVALSVGCRDPRVAALIGIGTPVGIASFGFLKKCRKPLALIQGEEDRFGPLGMLLTLAAALPGGAQVLAIKGAGHGFAGHLDELAARVAQAVPDDLRPPPVTRTSD